MPKIATNPGSQGGKATSVISVSTTCLMLKECCTNLPLEARVTIGKQIADRTLLLAGHGGRASQPGTNTICTCKYCKIRFRQHRQLQRGSLHCMLICQIAILVATLQGLHLPCLLFACRCMLLLVSFPVCLLMHVVVAYCMLQSAAGSAYLIIPHCQTVSPLEVFISCSYLAVPALSTGS